MKTADCGTDVSGSGNPPPAGGVAPAAVTGVGGQLFRGGGQKLEYRWHRMACQASSEPSTWSKLESKLLITDYRQGASARPGQGEGGSRQECLLE